MRGAGPDATTGTVVRVLGPVSVAVAGRPCTLPSPTARALFALLAVDAGRVVPVDRLLTELWGDEPAPSRTSSLHVYVSRLRRALGDAAELCPDGGEPPVRLRRRAPGYLLELPDGALDAARLARLATAARGRLAREPAAALALLDEALALVTGEPLADVAHLLGPSAAAEASRLSGLVLDAREARVEALLGTGRAGDAAREAEHLLTTDPMREGVLALHLLALYRSGRQSDALAAYDGFRRRLADELGVDPGPALRRLHGQLLQQDPVLDTGAAPLPVPDRRRAGAGTWTAPTAAAQPRDEAAPATLRAQQVAAVDEALRRLAEGEGGLWLLSGEAGIGKTRLAEQVLLAASGAGLATAQGKAQEAAEATPYWLWRGVLQDLPDLPRSGEVEVLLGAATTADPLPPTRPVLHDRTARLLLDRAAAGPPLLLVLEDVHWADEASLQLLALLAERVRAAPLLLLCTWRAEDVEPAGAFSAFLAHVARTPGVRRTHLTGLDVDETRALLSEELAWQPDTATVAAAQDRTGGNPFFLQELARLVRDAEPAAPAWQEVPGTVVDVLRHRVARLPGPARRLLDVAAVLGRECDLALLEAVSGLPGEDLDTALGAAVQSGLVTETPSSRPLLRFRHALVREALESRLGARARMRLHAEAGAAMAVRPDADPDALAHHLLAGGDLADATTTVRAVLAAVDRSMAQLAFDRSRSLLDRAVDLLPRLAEGPERDRLELGLQTRLGTVVATQVGFAAPAAQAVLERAQSLALRVEAGGEVEAALYRRFLWLLMAADFPAVRGFAEQVLEHAARLQPGVAQDRLGLLGHLARGAVLWCLGQAEPAVVELEVALDLAEQAGPGHAVSAFGDPAVRVRMFLCHALASAGRSAAAVGVADDMVALAVQSGPADESDALATRGMMYVVFGDPARTRADGVEGGRLSRLAGAELLGHFAALNESWGTALGDPAQAEQAAQQVRAAVAGYRATGTRMHDPIVLTMLAEVDAAAGHHDRAAAAARVGLAVLDRVGSTLWKDRLTAVLAVRPTA